MYDNHLKLNLHNETVNPTLNIQVVHSFDAAGLGLAFVDSARLPDNAVGKQLLVTCSSRSSTTLLTEAGCVRKPVDRADRHDFSKNLINGGFSPGSSNLNAGRYQ